MKRIVATIKHLVGFMPESIKLKLKGVPVFAKWYRKNLNVHYWTALQDDPLKQLPYYRSWIETKERESLEALNATDVQTKIIALRCVDEQSDIEACSLTHIIGSAETWYLTNIQNVNSLETVDANVRIIHIDKLVEAVNLRPDAWFCFLNETDSFAPHFEAVLSGTSDTLQDADVVYFDHDSLLDTGERFNPSFKPKWDPDLYLGTDYVSRAVIVSSELIQPVLAKWRPQSADEWVTRLLSSSSEIKVAHIPFVMFHLEEKETPKLNRQDVLLQSPLLNEANCLEAMETGITKVNWPNESKPLVSIIIPTRNGKKLVKACVESIRTKTNYPHYEILLVDNQSDSRADVAYFKRLEESGDVRLLHYDDEFNYSAINNFAVAEAKGSVIALVNNDIEVISGNWLDEMLQYAVRDDVGCVGAKLLYGEGVIQHAGVVIGYGGVAGHAHKYLPMHHPGYLNRLRVAHRYSAVTAACLVIRKSIYQKVGGLNETDLRVAFNDVDFCLKVGEAGYHNIWTPHAVLYHHESISRGEDNTPEKRQRFLKEVEFMKSKWKTDEFKDPCYNPNLTLKRENFSLGEQGE